MTAIELKPCPFCNSDELSHGWDEPGWDGRSHSGNVQCHNCGAFTLQDTESKAITAWNTRASESDLRRKLDFAREALGDIVDALSMDMIPVAAALARAAIATINGDSA